MSRITKEVFMFFLIGGLAYFYVRSAYGEESRPLVVKAVVKGGITNATYNYLDGAIEEALERDADALIIVLDTPGGLLEATREIVQCILQDQVPVVTYVAPEGGRAGSAGVFITLASHVAAMAPTTHLGAAHPVQLFGSNEDNEMSRKIENDTAAWAKSIAQTRKRSTEWAEKAVRESATLTARDAIEQKVVDLIAPDFHSLLEQLHDREVELEGNVTVLRTRNAQVHNMEMDGVEEIHNFMSDPNLMYFMLLGGLFLLFIEFKNPGLIIPGVVGALCVAFVLGLQLLPVNWFGVIFILISVVCFIAEIYVTSFGLLSIGGLVSLILGSYMLFDVTGSTFRVDPVVIWTVALTFASLILFVGFLLIRAKRQGPTSGVDAMIGEEGRVYRKISSHKPGQIHLRGAYWTALSEDEIDVDTLVRVTDVKGTKLYVQKKDNS